MEHRCFVGWCCSKPAHCGFLSRPNPINLRPRQAAAFGEWNHTSFSAVSQRRNPPRNALALSPARQPLGSSFSFFIYSVGMFVLLGEIVVESNTKAGAIKALRSFPSAELSRPTLQYLAVSAHWVSSLTTITFNLAVWLLWISVFYLLFIWKVARKSESPAS